MPAETPPHLHLPASASSLAWGMSLDEARAVPGRVSDERPPLVRYLLADAATLQGVALEVSLLFELGRLVRIELAGPLDAPALAALGLSPETLADADYHRFAIGRTRVTVDLLDRTIALEPDEDEVDL